MEQEPPTDGENLDCRDRKSAGRKTFRLSRDRNDAELLHHAQSVPITVRVHDFSIRDMVDGHAVNGDFPICGWNAHEIAFVGAGKSPAGNHFILLDNGVLHGETQIRVAREEAHYLVLVGFRTNRGTGNIRSVKSVAGRDNFPYDFKLSLVPDFLIETKNDG